MTHPYSNFNVDQLVPVLSDITLAKNIIGKMTQSLNDYMESLYEIINELKESGIISDEMKAKTDKNVVAILNDLSANLNQMVSFRNLGTKKEKLFERLKRGINYKYKLDNGAVVENPELLKFDVIKIDPIHRTFEIGDQIFQFSDSTDYVPNASECMSDFLNYNDDQCEEQKVALFLSKLQLEISKSLTIQAYLDILASCISYSMETIQTDIIHFNLFDKTILDSI